MTAVETTKPSGFVISVPFGKHKSSILVGPFYSMKAAGLWGEKNVTEGEWQIEPVYSPFYEYVDGSK